MEIKTCEQYVLDQLEQARAERDWLRGKLEQAQDEAEELRGKLRTLLDESALLGRKVKEAVLQQKQREREFVQAKRAIERIRMAI